MEWRNLDYAKLRLGEGARGKYFFWSNVDIVTKIKYIYIIYLYIPSIGQQSSEGVTGTYLTYLSRRGENGNVRVSADGAGTRAGTYRCAVPFSPLCAGNEWENASTRSEKVFFFRFPSHPALRFRKCPNGEGANPFLSLSPGETPTENAEQNYVFHLAKRISKWFSLCICFFYRLFVCLFVCFFFTRVNV